MSYIDTFDHELVGFFAGLPLYHPLERGRHKPNFGVRPYVVYVELPQG